MQRQNDTGMDRKTKIIKAKLYSYLKTKGYQYEYDITDGETWIFKKIDGDLEKRIDIHDTANIGISFWFSVYGYGQQDGMRWISKSRINEFDHCDYKNEKEFESLIEEIKDVIMQHADEVLENIGGTFEEREAARNIEKKLYREHEQLAEEGEKLLKIENETDMQKIYVLIEYLKKLQERDYQAVFDEIFIISAIYGEIYREITNGKWELSCDGTCMCMVVAPKCIDIAPFKTIKLAWEHHDYETLISKIRYAELSKRR